MPTLLAHHDADGFSKKIRDEPTLQFHQSDAATGSANAVFSCVEYQAGWLEPVVEANLPTDESGEDKTRRVG
jgi:hypothetical protein